MPTAPPVFMKTQRKAWQGHTASKRKLLGRALQRERQRLFAEHPLCKECESHDRVVAAVIRDHIRPLAEGGEDVRSNTQGLCQACSDAKTKVEAQRGRAAERR